MLIEQEKCPHANLCHIIDHLLRSASKSIEGSRQQPTTAVLTDGVDGCTTRSPPLGSVEAEAEAEAGAGNGAEAQWQPRSQPTTTQ